MTVIYILTRGGPYDTTQVIPTEAFFAGILGSDLAEGAAISIFLVPLLVIAAYFVLRSAHRAEVTEMARRRLSKVLPRIVMWLVRIFFAVVLAFPFYWMLITTFKRN